MKFPCLILLSAAVFIAAGGLSSGQNIEPVSGSQIGWASQAFATNYMADGVTTFEQAGQSIYFQLGTFTQGFDPSTATPDQWAANWLVLQGTDGSPQVVYNNDDQQFIQTSTLSSNATPFAEGGQAYIWGFTSKDVTPTSQWILLAAPTWKWPNAGALQSATFSVSDATPQNAIMGSVNPAGGGYHMQLEYVVVPEPSASLLAAAAFGLVWRRRR